MENENTLNILEYNTHREKMTLPEYGRGVQKMVDEVKKIEDREKRTRQARAIVRVMEILNPSIHLQDNWENALWDHLFIIAGYDLDIDAPYPVPQKTSFEASPMKVPIQKKPIKATHYGRNIESIIDLISEKEEGEVKTAMIRDLAIYMRTQYLIWNKDSVEDKTIFKDIERISGGRIVVPEGVELTPLSKQAIFNRPGIMQSASAPQNNQGRGSNKHGGRNKKRR